MPYVNEANDTRRVRWRDGVEARVDLELYEEVPHLDRERNFIMSRRRPEKSKNCYIGCNMIKAVVNHAFQGDRTRFYHIQSTFLSSEDNT
jgi:hypothetical protein